jgi:hypothetical protein
MTAEILSIISSLATIAVLVVAGVVLKPYLAGYSQRKGETRALHEDIEKILEQLRERVIDATAQARASARCSNQGKPIPHASRSRSRGGARTTG